ncbi:MAG: lytic transglycosylase domain-containing protein [Boseongicola sp.]
MCVGRSAARKVKKYASAGILIALLAVPATAQTTQVGGDFTFRRVAVPKPGAKRIIVQIDPAEEVYRITPGSDPRRPGDPRPEAATQLPPGLVPEGSSDYAWYWEAVSPAIDVNAAERFQAALTAVQRGATKVGTPRLQSLKAIAESHGVDILTSTIGTEVSPALVLAVISVESAGKTEAISHAGASGLMQLMPATAARFGVDDTKDARQNIRGGVAYLDWLLKEFGRDPILALAGYNAGEGAVAKHSGVPPFAETRAYVPKVLAAWNVARGLCMTPPTLITDGCVFIGPTIVSNGG